MLTYLKYENEEVDNSFKEFLRDFNEVFSEEIKFKKYKEEHKDKPTSPIERPKSNLKSGPFHKIFKLIARKTHPDHHGDTYAEEFKGANSAFEERKWEELLSIAVDLGIDIPAFTKEEEELINARTKSISDYIENIKNNSLVWRWGTSTENKELLKALIRSAMDIDEEEFQKFVKNNS